MEEIMSNRESILEILSKAKAASSVSPDRAIEMSNEAYQMSRDGEFKREEGFSLLGAAYGYRVKSDVGNLLDMSLAARQIFEELDDHEGLMRALNLAGVAYFYSSLYEEAMRNFLKALDYSKVVNDPFLESSVLNNIAEVYRETLSYNKAIEFYKRAEGLSRENGLDINRAVILGNIGEIYLKESKPEEALKYFESGKMILKEMNDPISLAEIESRIGQVYQAMGGRVEAEEQYKKSLTMLETLENKYYSIDILTNLASLYAETDLDEAMELLAIAISYAEEIDAKKKISSVYRQIASINEDYGNYSVALDYFKLYCSYSEKQSNLALGNRLEILNIELKHTTDFEQLNQLKDRFEHEIKLQKLEIERMNEMNRSLEKKISEDELTGILNRRAINKKLHEIAEAARDEKFFLTVYMLDIDNFKMYNDHWGHSDGDKCLISITKAISSIAWSRNDIFGRYGGEEFVYIARTKDYDTALGLGEEIREEVEKLGLYYGNGSDKTPTTISIGGVVGSGEELSSVPRLLQMADDQLYISKRSGKNRVRLISLD